MGVYNEKMSIETQERLITGLESVRVAEVNGLMLVNQFETRNGLVADQVSYGNDGRWVAIMKIDPQVFENEEKERTVWKKFIVRMSGDLLPSDEEDMKETMEELFYVVCGYAMKMPVSFNVSRNTWLDRAKFKPVSKELGGVEAEQKWFGDSITEYELCIGQ